jgi:hypothetical protein
MVPLIMFADVTSPALLGSKLPLPLNPVLPLYLAPDRYTDLPETKELGKFVPIKCNSPDW